MLARPSLAFGLAALAAQPTPEPVLLVPPIVSPGEEVELAVLEGPRGAWTVGGAAASSERGVLRVRVPESAPLAQALRAQVYDPAGARLGETLLATRVALTPPHGPARLLDAGAWGVIGDVVALCGSFPPSSWDGIRVAGRPVRRVAASRRVLFVQLPPELAPGPHLVSGDVDAGVPPGDAVLLDAVRVNARVDRPDLLRGQRGRMEVEARGTLRPIPLRLVNETPRVVELAGGAEQTSSLPGGPLNRREWLLRALRAGDFRIRHRVDPLPADCAGRLDADPSAGRPAPYVPGRALALIAPGPPEAMQRTAQAVAAAHGLTVLELHRLATLGEGLVVFAAGQTEVPLRVAALRADPRVRLAQPDLVHRTVAAASQVAAPPGTYGRRLIGADRLPAGLDGSGVTVALVDTGVDGAHPALKGRVASEQDVTGEGFTPDLHGTLLAGIVAGARGEAPGGPGVAPGTRLLAVKACQPESPRALQSQCRSSWLARGLDAAVAGGARVVNLSVAGERDALVGRVIDAAVRRGTLVVAAAGNRPGAEPAFPAAHDAVLAVTAVDAAEALYLHAQRGGFVDLAAPGVDVLSTAPGGQAVVFSGTSAAAAFASGALALTLQARSIGPRQARDLLESNARDLGAAGRDADYGHGLLDVCRAIAGGGAACR